jgi:hypothetical protein
MSAGFQRAAWPGGSSRSDGEQGGGGRLLRGLEVAEDGASNHTDDVRVHRRRVLLEPEGADDGGGEGADAREGEQRDRIARHRAVVPFEADARGLVEGGGATGVAGASPDTEHVRAVRARQRVERGAGPLPASVDLEDARHLGLLRRDGGDHGGVGVVRGAPGEGLLVRVVPAQEAGAEGADAGRREEDGLVGARS